MRVRIVLAADAEPDATNMTIAARLGVSRQSVITWRQRFLQQRLDGSASPSPVGTGCKMLRWRIVPHQA